MTGLPFAAPPFAALRWPAPADEAAGQRLLERFAEQGEAAARFAAGSGAAMLRGVGGASPFLTDLMVREHAAVLDMARRGFNAAVVDAVTAVRAMEPNARRVAMHAGLRRAKRLVALGTALADIGGAWPLSQVTGAMSALAESAVGAVVNHLLRTAHDAGELKLPDPERPGSGSGLIVLGMGKLGARELNYSSDIDLILLYDPDAHPNPDTLGATFTRIARALVSIMEARDADGYVFRTDLRLRPDPAATPPAVALPAATAYYESLGQNWERAAMTKARPVAGDFARGESFLQAIRPFVWRRQLDFAAIADLHGMKRRIDTHRGFSGLAGPGGRDVKLGPGGIREIEFIAQTLQLVWGGRDPALRDVTTLGALRGLVRAGRLPRRTAAELMVAYRLLRRVEHRLQMVADRQTHRLPEKPEDLERLAVFLGCNGTTEFAALLELHQARVRARYSEVFGPVPVPEGVEPLDVTGVDIPPATAERLQALGFNNVAGTVGTLRGWKAGRLRALRSARARELMDSVVPSLLEALARQPDPDAAFNRFDAMLARQPAGVQLLSMMQRNKALLARVASVLGAAPMLADHLAMVPSALEGLLAPPPEFVEPPEQLLARRLKDARALEDVLAITRTFVRAEEFALCVAQMEGEVDADLAGFARTALADAALRALLPAVLAEQECRHGRVRGGDIAVVALGKAGSREMMAGSDLDLVLLYSHPSQVTESDGPRPMAASQWFIRAAHAFVAALTAQGAEGPLYAVDVRLRPSGNKGPVAVPLAGFVKYHAGASWTWERMALTRARVVAGRPAIRARAERAIAQAVRPRGDPVGVRRDAADMRARLARDLPPTGPWDVKMRLGGGMEVEFVAQVLQLLHGMRPGGQVTAAALRGLADADRLTRAEASMLARADLLWRTVQSMLRITVGRATDPLPPAAASALLRAASTVVGRPLDLPSLHAMLDAAARDVRRVFDERIGGIE